MESAHWLLLNVLTYKLPDTKAALRRFLGMLKFYRRFLPHAAVQIIPLNRYLRNKKNEKTIIEWSTEKQTLILEIERNPY